MRAPAFSIFSAVSEIFVTAGVFYVLWRNWNRKPFPFAMFLAVALFEAFVNVLYMANRTAQAASGAESLPMGMKLAFAAHGLLSLGAYLAFVILAVLAYLEQRGGRFFFRERPGLTWIFVAVWTISVVSGEALFVMRYVA